MSDNGHIEASILWRRIKQGDAQAFTAVFNTFSPELYDYGMRLSPSPPLVKDSIQEVFAVLWTKRTTLDIQTSLRGYLFASYRNDLIRRMTSERRSGTPDQVGFELSTEAVLCQQEQQLELQNHLKSAIQSLSPRQKEIIFLRFQQDLSYDEIAKVMQVNQNSMYKLYSYALQRLRSYFRTSTSYAVMERLKVIPYLIFLIATG